MAIWVPLAQGGGRQAAGLTPSLYRKAVSEGQVGDGRYEAAPYGYCLMAHCSSRFCQRLVEVNPEMTDLAFIGLTIAAFAAVLLVAGGVERL
ncbi:hypothetical protein ACWCXX_33425 [Streptomyces sp. NPDC001732]